MRATLDDRRSSPPVRHDASLGRRRLAGGGLGLTALVLIWNGYQWWRLGTNDLAGLIEAGRYARDAAVITVGLLLLAALVVSPLRYRGARPAAACALAVTAICGLFLLIATADSLASESGAPVQDIVLIAAALLMIFGGVLALPRLRRPRAEMRPAQTEPSAH